MLYYNLSPKDFAILQQKSGTQIIFIRDGENHSSIPLPENTHQVRFAEVKAYLLRLLQTTSENIVVCCMFGSVSEELVEEFRDSHDASNVYNLKGGIIRWHESQTPDKGNQQIDTRESVRYSRQISLDGIGKEGQSKLKSARVLLVGCGGLGCPVLVQLTAAGVGQISLVDKDTISLSNLNRQFLFSEDDIGKNKVDIAGNFARTQNPYCNVSTHCEFLSEDNAHELITTHDIVIDATDSYATRYLLNKVCVQHKKPLIFGSVQGYVGQVALFNSDNDSPCYECLFPEPPPSELRKSCDINGVLGNLPSMIGSMQASKAIKYILFDEADNKLTQFSFMNETFKQYKIGQRADCFCTNLG